MKIPFFDSVSQNTEPEKMQAPRATATALPGMIQESLGQNADSGKNAQSIQKNAESEESLGQNTESGKHAESIQKNAEIEKRASAKGREWKKPREQSKQRRGRREPRPHCLESQNHEKQKLGKIAQHSPFLERKLQTTSDTSRPQPLRTLGDGGLAR